ncbi:MAG: hypothetical protein Q9225_001672 [Loekoesia sp. 1 TL-2023]
MCHHEVEKFACGHDEKHKIPCESFCDNGSCSKPDDDQVRENAGPKCTKCKDDEDETDFIQEELRKFAERESLNLSAAPTARSRDPNAPKLYFKRCIVWTRCGHHSHPRPSDIERDEGDPEYLHVEGIGNCFDCSAAPPSTIAKMKQNGDYEKEDPWGAMSRTEVAEGSSRGANLPSLEEIGQGVTHDQVKEQVHESASVSPPSSPERAGDRSKSAAPSYFEYDTGPVKGKGHPGRPIRPLAHVTTVEDAESDDEDRFYHSSKKSAKLSDSGEEVSDEEEDDNDDEAHHHQLHKSKKLPGHPPSLSEDEADDQGHFSGDEGAHGKGYHRGRAMHRDHSDEESDHFDDMDDASDVSDAGSDEEGDDLAKPKELKAAGLAEDAEMTKVELQRHMRRKVEEGRIALMQSKKGEIE